MMHLYYVQYYSRPLHTVQNSTVLCLAMQNHVDRKDYYIDFSSNSLIHDNNVPAGRILRIMCTVARNKFNWCFKTMTIAPIEIDAPRVKL
jgi:hypothetical protein